MKLITKWTRQLQEFALQHRTMQQQKITRAGNAIHLSRRMRGVSVALVAILISNLCFDPFAVPTARAEGASNPQYLFQLGGFSISNTMASHEDTDFVFFTVRVGTIVLQRYEKVGELNNGDYPLNWDLGALPVGPNDPIIITYQIVNMGHGSEQDAAAIATAIQSAAAGIAGAAVSSGQVVIAIISGALSVVGAIANLLLANCDGIVLNDTITADQQTLAAWTHDAGTHTETHSYTGPETPSGCGSNAQYTVTWSIIRATPVVVCGTADNSWHANDVEIACTVSSTGGTMLEPDSTVTLSTHVADNTETATATTDSRTLCASDSADKCATAGPIGNLKVDKKPPTLVINTPSNAVYTLNQQVLADYTCADGGAGLASCNGTIARGSAIDTFSLGQKIFTISATDLVGHTTAQSIYYSVVYPAPKLTGLSPASTFVGAPDLTVAAIGEGFVPASVLVWNGVSLPTTFVDASHLTVILPAAYLIRSSTAEIHVVTPPPGGGTSESCPFVITANTPAQRLEFFRQPGDTNVDATFAQPIVVRALDASNNIATNFNGPVTLALREGSGTASAQLGGTTTVLAVNGVATFSDLTIDRAGQQYVLIARSPSLGQPDSTLFSVQPATSYLAMALRVLPDQTTDTQFDATLTLQNRTGADLPAGTGIRWFLQGLTFDPNDRSTNTLTGATLSTLTLPQFSAQLDAPLAQGASLTMTLHLTLTQPVDAAKLSLKAVTEGNIGGQNRRFTSNAVSSSTMNGATRVLNVVALGSNTPGPLARFIFSGDFFADSEPLSITTTIADSFQPLPARTSDTGKMSVTTFRGLAPGHYIVHVMGLWSSVTAQAEVNLAETNPAVTSIPISTATLSSPAGVVETSLQPIFLPIVQR